MFVCHFVTPLSRWCVFLFHEGNSFKIIHSNFLLAGAAAHEGAVPYLRSAIQYTVTQALPYYADCTSYQGAVCVPRRQHVSRECLIALPTSTVPPMVWSAAGKLFFPLSRSAVENVARSNVFAKGRYFNVFTYSVNLSLEDINSCID